MLSAIGIKTFLKNQQNIRGDFRNAQEVTSIERTTDKNGNAHVKIMDDILECLGCLANTSNDTESATGSSIYVQILERDGEVLDIYMEWL